MLDDAMPRIVGRDAELARLDGFLGTIPSGFAALLLEGPAGIGKTTLWERAVASARERGHAVLVARAVASEAQLAYMVLHDLLGPVADEVLPDLPGPQRAALEVALVRRHDDGTGPDPRAVSLGTLAVLRGLAARRILLVAVDDVQWMDEPSARVLESCIRRLGPEPVGFVGSIRTEPAGRAALSLDRSEGRDRIVHLPVGPLSVGALHHVLVAHLGTSFPRPSLLRIRELSGGNPFFALEIGRALLASGTPIEPGQPLPVPDTLAGLLRDRVRRLPTSTKEALLAVALLSHPSEPALGRVLGGEDAAHEALLPALEQGIVAIDGSTVRFTHPLLGSTVISLAPPSGRREMHRRLAASLADREECARHLALAATGPDEALAAVLEAAAEHATGRGAPHAAAELAGLAARLTPPERADDVRRRNLHAGGAYFEAGDVGLALRLLERALAHSSSGTFRAEVLFRIAMVRAEVEGVTAADPAFRRALSEPGVSPGVAATVGEAHAYTLLLRGDVEGAHEAAREAVRRSEESSDRGAAALALGMLGMVEFCRGKGVPTELMRRAIALEEASGQHLWRDDAPSTLYAAMLMWSGDLDGARERLRAMHDAAEGRGDSGALGIVSFFLSLLECRAADFVAAERHAVECEDVFLLTERAAEESPVLYCRAQVAAYQGRLEAARSAAERGAALARRLGYSWFEVHNLWVLGFVELSNNNPAGALEHLESAGRRWHEIGVLDPGIFLLQPDLVEVLVASGRVEEAEELLGTYEERSRALDRAAGLAVASRCRALVSASRRDLPGALEHIVRALAAHGPVPMPFELARTHLVEGQIRRRAKQKRPARAALERALEIFEDLGTPVWAEKARLELGRVGGRSASATELTPTERQVAEAVASGMSNREAADALFLSVSTVEDNLTRAYRKLGVRSRTELSRALTGPTDPSRPA
jgi:DNA-binding CsgD family transcriptional regulator